jgi:hypothetical protein
MAEQADADASKASVRKGVRVRIPLSALHVSAIAGPHLPGGHGIVGWSRDNGYMYPRSTVEAALVLSEADVLDRETALICGVSIGSIRHWRHGTRQSAAASGHATSTCPRCDGRTLDEPAYAYLLGLYLGDGNLTRGRRDVFALNIACCDAYPGLITAAREAITAAMPANKVFAVGKVGCTLLKSTSKHWPCLFPQHGPGRKHTRSIALEPWQQEIVQAFPGAFVKGLFHSDGCRVTNRVRRPCADGDRWYAYPRYFFSNESADILGLCGAALDRLEISWRFARRNAISVARREAVARLDEFVGQKY